MALTDIAAGGGQRAGSGRTPLGLVLALTSVSFFMVALDALVVVTALPAIHRSIGGSVATLEWAVNSYALTFAAGIITAAALGDRLGRRRVYVAGLVLFTVASAACALAPTAGTLIAARAVQGIGSAAVTPLSLTILTGAFPPARRGAIIGIWGGIGGLAIAGGPLVGGAVVQGLDWHCPPRRPRPWAPCRPRTSAGRPGSTTPCSGSAARSAWPSLPRCSAPTGTWAPRPA
jgi:MFS family permease